MTIPEERLHPSHRSESAPRSYGVNPRTPWKRVVILGLATGVAVIVILLAFIWPTITSTVKDLPLAVAGPSSQVSAMKSNLTSGSTHTFDITVVSSRAEAVHKIRIRESYGAIILGDKPEVLIASANGAAVKAIMTSVASRIQDQANQQVQRALQEAIAEHRAPEGAKAPTITVPITDIVPLASGDPQGSALLVAALPLVIGGILGGVLFSILLVGDWRRISAIIIYGVGAGLAIAAILQGWLAVIQGSYLLNVLAIGMSLIATASFVVGASALIGRVGIAVGGVLTMLFGNPLSAAAEPQMFLPGPWGSIGQWFVPGASISLIRDISYFPDADSSFSWLVLAGWTVLGLLAVVLGRFRNQEVSHAAE